MLRLMNAAAAAVCIVSLAGCSDLVTGGDLIRPGEPTGLIEVINNSDTTLTAVLISQCDASTYGLNRMPDGVSIPYGGSYAFQVSAGCWDVDAGAYGAEARQRMQVASGGVVQYTVN